MERKPTDFGRSEETPAKSSSDFMGRLERILTKPAVQQRLLAEAPEEVQQAVMTEFTDSTDAPSTDAEPTDSSSGEVTPEKMAEFLGEIEEQVGGGYTVTQLRTFTETNPEMVENLLQQYL